MRISCKFLFFPVKFLFFYEDHYDPGVCRAYSLNLFPVLTRVGREVWDSEERARKDALIKPDQQKLG